MTTVYLNGEYLPIQQAKVSVLDRGFLFADGVYEVIPAYGGRAFRLTEHLARLQDSLDAIRLDNPLSNADWDVLFDRLLSEHPGKDQSIYLQITRGAPLERDHSFPPDCEPTVFAMSSMLKGLPQNLRENGVSAITLEDIRWKFCNIKSIALLANVMLRQEAVDQGSMEAILVCDEMVTEGAASNVFIVKDGELYTPPKSEFLLPGITRDLVVELAQKNQIPLHEENITRADLEAAEEVWLTSSTKEVVSVTKLDGALVGDGTPGKLWHCMYELYQAYKAELRQAS